MIVSIMQIAFSVLSLIFLSFNIFYHYKYCKKYKSAKEREWLKIKYAISLSLMIISFVVAYVLFYFTITITNMSVTIATIVIGAVMLNIDSFCISKSSNPNDDEDVFTSVMLTSLAGAILLAFCIITMFGVNGPRDIRDYTLENVTQTTEEIEIAEKEKIITTSLEGSIEVSTEDVVTALYLKDASSEVNSIMAFYSFDNPNIEEPVKHEVEASELDIVISEDIKHPYYVIKKYEYSYVSSNDPHYKDKKEIEVYEVHLRESDLVIMDMVNIEATAK